ncbi:uncharacterized protein LOC129945099 [Eupeodes corollae]|uniref:uncharacterized protein LOC129945099 n=1 Tax=Eupeodes corollae TaxID=290404 RepID=UPI0024915E14|nr:uncharacterized protein LOC129945099 [Eupeodes corollae]
MYSIALREMINDEEEKQKQKSIRRQLRDSSNPLELREPLFHQHYRVNKEAFKYLLDVLSSSLPPVKQKFGVPPIIKLAATLRFLAEGGYQKGVGKDHEVGLAQPSVSLIMAEVLNVLEERLCPEWIKWPTQNECRRISQDFFMKFNMPSIIGCVDGTHVNIISPSHNKHLFYNRKDL